MLDMGRSFFLYILDIWENQGYPIQELKTGHCFKSHALRGKFTECPAMIAGNYTTEKTQTLIAVSSSGCSPSVQCVLWNVEKWRNEEMAGTHSVIQAQHASTLLRPLASYHQDYKAPDPHTNHLLHFITILLALPLAFQTQKKCL